MDSVRQLEGLLSRSLEREAGEIARLAGDVLEQLPVPVAIAKVTKPGREPELIHANQTFTELTGVRPSPRARSRLKLLAVDARPAAEERRLLQHFADNQAVSETLILGRSGGEGSSYVVDWRPLVTAVGNGGYWTATLTRTTSETETQRALQVSEDRLAAIFEYSPVDICLKDAVGRYTQVSRRFEELYGVTNEEIKGKLPQDVGIGEDWAQQVREVDLRVLQTRQAQVFEETIPFRGGIQESITVKFPLFNAAGEVEGIGTICSDITERRAAERALMRSELEATRSRALLSEAIESMTDGFVWFDNEGRLVLCNQRYRDLFPKLADEFKPGAFYADLMKLAFDRGQLTVLSRSENRIMDRQLPEAASEYPTFRTKTSEGRWIEARNHPLESGGFIGIRFDVTGQVMAEEAVRESEQRFKDFAESGPGGFWEMDEDLRFSAFLDVQTDSGRARPSAAEATGRTLWELFGGDAEKGPLWRDLRRDLQARKPVRDLRVAFVSSEGESTYWRINGKPYYDHSGRFRGYRGVAEDESVTVLARQRAESAEERLIDAIESISGGFALFDREDRLVLCNKAYKNRGCDGGRFIYPGATFEEILRANVEHDSIVGLNTREEKEAWIQQRLARHLEASGSIEIPWADQHTYLMTERRTHDGGIACVFADITELNRARQLAEQANQAKTRFLAAASHDLRQPLHAIELFVAALEATLEDAEARGIIADLREASNAAGRLLNALLDVSELESGKLEGRFMHFPVQQLLDRMVRVYGPQARERGLTLTMVPSSQVIYSDPNLLERILGNLLSNAVRYTPEGRILIGCRKHKNKLRIEVWDTGLGIPENERQRIFEEFHQLDNAARERKRGIGLGLSIVRRLANILGHEIFLHSVRGQGSVFAVELDQTGKLVDLSSRPHRGLAQLSAPAMVLVIDDDEQVRKGMQRALESWGCRVRVARDYEAAAQIVEQAADEIDLIIADYRLPKACNGVRAAGRLRVLCGRMVPVLIVTADQGEAEMNEIAEQGFPTLQKPVHPESLKVAVSGLLEGEALRRLQSAQ